MKYRNVHKFSRDVPETRHDGHEVRIVRLLASSECDIAEAGQMAEVRCALDGEVFQVFPEEIGETQ